MLRILPLSVCLSTVRGGRRKYYKVEPMVGRCNCWSDEFGRCVVVIRISSGSLRSATMGKKEETGRTNDIVATYS